MQQLPFVILHLHRPERYVKVMTSGVRVECMGHESMLWNALQAANAEADRLRARVQELEAKRDER